MKSRVPIFAIFLVCFCLGCAQQVQIEKENESGSSAVSQEESKVDDMYDPIEPVNRGIFWFNDKFDRYLLGPVAHGYMYIVPEFARESVSNFFSNLEFPIHFVADLIELQFGQALKDTGRFAVNTTVGLAGLLDVATPIGLEKNKNDIGVALGRQGVSSGFYIVLPFIGSSNLRDAIGLGASAFVTPTAIMTYAGVDSDTTFWVTVGTRALEIVDTRARLDDAVKTARESSIDYYLFMQSAYMQYRNGLIKGEKLTHEDMFRNEPKNPEEEAAEARALLNDD
ncbi:MAG: VacJ family lipoprotein [SAR324 cluster bacterium]|uniref:VacJ family lipoprotein n=1 Tax=SAR324 cluster bacterium TaxID=2024889 RepID=A0A7X9FQJ8_9DELT|nr:VacJ family lipoprotein [SAR324 cluster bacterium]